MSDKSSRNLGETAKIEFHNDFSVNYHDGLTPLEAALKQAESSHPEAHADRPQTLAEAERILRLLPEGVRQKPEKTHPGSSLSEDSFFPEGLDVSVHRHDRYLPAILHAHDFIELVCVLRGSCVNHVGRESYALRRGDVCIISPGATHAIWAGADDDRIFNILIRTSTFESVFFSVLSGEDILSDFFLRLLYHSENAPHLLFHTGDDPRIEFYTAWIVSEYEHPSRYGGRALASLVSLFFIWLIRFHGVDLQTDLPAEEDKIIVGLLQYLQAHYTTVTLTELSDFSGYSTRQVQRILKDATGQDFRQNIRRMKMAEAGRLLRETSLTTEVISEKLGYTSAESFRHAFRSFYQTTPAAFRAEGGENTDT